jgi:hypothetical protein
MGQLLQPGSSKDWRSGDGQTRWLSALVDAMERVSRSEFRSLPCDSSVLIALGAQLSRPASPLPYGGSTRRLLN